MCYFRVVVRTKQNCSLCVSDFILIPPNYHSATYFCEHSTRLIKEGKFYVKYLILSLPVYYSHMHICNYDGYSLFISTFQGGYSLVKFKFGQCKVAPVILTERHAMKVYWESGDIIPRVLDLGTRCGQLHALAA